MLSPRKDSKITVLLFCYCCSLKSLLNSSGTKDGDDDNNEDYYHQNIPKLLIVFVAVLLFILPRLFPRRTGFTI